MFCKKCGKVVDNDSVFCTYCGAKQKNLEEKKYDFVTISEQAGEKPIEKYEIKKVKYDLNYKSNEDDRFLGIVLLTITLLFAIFEPIIINKHEEFLQATLLINFISFIIRILITAKVIRIAKLQNRVSSSWGFFAFFMPSIALIVQSYQKKVFAHIDIDDNLSNQENSNLLTSKAKKFYDLEMYADSTRFLKQALIIDPNNISAADIFKKVEGQANNSQREKNLIATYLTEKGEKLKVYRENINGKIIENIFYNGFTAIDGHYKVNNGCTILIVNDGQVYKAKNVEIFKKFYVEQQTNFVNKIGDEVFLTSGSIAPNGKYSTGIFASTLFVENGKIFKIQ